MARSVAAKTEGFSGLPAFTWLNRMFIRMATTAAELMLESKMVPNQLGKCS